MNPYYVKCSGGWFAFEDGHYVTNSTFKRATQTNSLKEAIRMLGYAKKDCFDARIVHAKITTIDIENIDELTHKELLDSAMKKITLEEYNAIYSKIAKELT